MEQNMQAIELPSNVEAEKRVLSVMMTDENMLYYAIEKLNPEDFFDQAHAKIFLALKELTGNNMGIDPITLSDCLKGKNELTFVGGEAYLDHIHKFAILDMNVESYIEIIFQKSILRKLIKAAQNIYVKASKGGNAMEALEYAEKEMFNVSVSKSRSDFVALDMVLDEYIEFIKTRPPHKDGLTGVTTGLKGLNFKLSGFQKSDLIILAARPSMGKTALGLNFAMKAATAAEGENVPVGIFSLEMSREQLAMRMLAAQSTVELNRIKTGDLDEDDFDNIALAMRTYRNSKIFISECPAASVTEIRSQCRKLKAKHGLGLVLIDYLQLMTGDGESNQIMVSNISKSLKALAIEMECPVIALSQLSRKTEERKDHRPILSDLRDSGSIEQDADIVMFLFREEYYEPDREDLKSLAELNVAKNRNGEIGTVKLNWIPEWQLFEMKADGDDFPGEEYFPEY